MITEKWTKKDLAALKREGFKKEKDSVEDDYNGYVKKVGKMTYIVYRQEGTVVWAKYLRVISNPDTDYYDEDEIASLSDLFDTIKRDTELNKLVEAKEKPKMLDLAGKYILIDGVNYKLTKV